MQPRSKFLFAALALSLILHALALFGLPRLGATRPDVSPQPQILAAYLVPAQALTPKVAPRVPLRVRPEPKAKPEIKTQSAAPAIDDASIALHAAEAAWSEALAETAAGSGTAVAKGSDTAVAGDAVAAQDAAPPVAAAPTPSHAVKPYPIRQARLVFDLYYGAGRTLVGQLTHLWRQVDGHYSIETSAEAVGFASLIMGGRYVQRSEGYISEAGLQPLHYSLEEGGKRESADFLWEQNKLNFQRGHKHAEAELRADAQDVLSILHALYFMQPFSRDTLVNVATGRRLESYLFQPMGEEDLITPIGRVRSLHLKRVGPAGAVTEVWLDRDRYLLPVKIYSVNRKGYILEQDIRELNFELVNEGADKADVGPPAQAEPMLGAN